jgi:hypothetical membrane protein
MKILFLLGSMLFTSLVYSADNTTVVNSQSDRYLIPTAVCILGVSMVAAHIAAPKTYSFKKNTISDLAAQNYENAWLMRAGFIGFGSLVTTAALLDALDNKKPLICTVPIMAYGLSMMASGFFSTAPFNSGIHYSEREATIHSIFANLAGISLTTAIIGHAIAEHDPKIRLAHISGMAFVMINSTLFKIDPERQGLYQRILWTGSLIWLTVSFSI